LEIGDWNEIVRLNLKIQKRKKSGGHFGMVGVVNTCAEKVKGGS